MTVFFGIISSSIQEVQAPFVFDVEQGIALHPMQGNRTSSDGEREVSQFFSSCGGKQGCILELEFGWPFKIRVCSAKSRLMSSCEGHLEILTVAWQSNRDASLGET